MKAKCIIGSFPIYKESIMSIRSTQRGRAAVFGVLCMFASGAAFADWACTKKETDATPAQPATNPADTVKDAKEAVNKLRRLFGK